ncbi:hypothetical protein FCULG_00012145 [Fusarium culmorum]|uniref:GIY-YIG domain-containing protein n=1 Tax=Fusarium culmorum TaxID=5516 RepID=A0A2T4GF67_FUSCU|nr:hypothetical protein FCULG_00012145 [Fusarium culmorum]
MASPLALPPDRPGDMRAIRINTSRTVNVELPDGGTRDITFTAGTVGYLLFDIPERDKCAVQLINHMGQRLDCTVPRRLIDIGELSSNFTIRQPRIVQSQRATTISHLRANDAAGRAIRFLWDDLHTNASVLGDLRLKTDSLNEVLDDPSKKRDAINTIIASFSNQSWTAVNTPGLPISAFHNVPRITQTEPRILGSQTMIYLRVYIDGDRFATYTGRSGDPIQRQKQHDKGIRDDTNGLQHYKEARKYPAANRYALQMMLLTDASEIVIKMAETTLCCLLGTWHPALTRSSHTRLQDELGSGSTGSINHMVLMSSFGTVVANALERANYPKLGGEAREWIRYKIQTADRRSMLVYRWQSSVVRLDNQLAFNLQFGGRAGDTEKCFRIQSKLGHLPGIKKGVPLVVSVEVMEDGKPHPTPWYRGPIHGAWDNCHELHSFTIKVEWKDQATNQWYTYPAGYHDIISVFEQRPGDSTITRDWRKATCILQFFHNRRYRNPPSYLRSHYSPLIREAVYDHLSQSISFQIVPQVALDPPAHVSFAQNFMSLGKASESSWPAIAVGLRPHQSWFGSSANLASCVLCQQSRGSIKNPLTLGCGKREGDFHVAADEPHRDRILQASCRLCWGMFRRPCIWVKIAQWTEDSTGAAVNKLRGIHPSYYGAAITPEYNGGAIPIEAPMTVETYQQLEADMEETAALDDGLGDDEQD